MEALRHVLSHLTDMPLVVDALDIWNKGGWAMYALFFNAMLMFGIGVNMLLKLIFRGLFLNPDRAWRQFQAQSKKRGGLLRGIIAEAMTCKSIAELEDYFSEVQKDEVQPFERDLPLMQMCVGSAPLLGLLGTVTGMLTTFGALATGGGGDKTMGMIAGGISEALITTMTGLVIALTGLIFQAYLTRQHASYAKRITHVETLCIKHFRNEGATVLQSQ